MRQLGYSLTVPGALSIATSVIPGLTSCSQKAPDSNPENIEVVLSSRAKSLKSYDVAQSKALLEAA